MPSNPPIFLDWRETRQVQFVLVLIEVESALQMAALWGPFLHDGDRVFIFITVPLRDIEKSVVRPWPLADIQTRPFKRL